MLRNLLRGRTYLLPWVLWCRVPRWCRAAVYTCTALAMVLSGTAGSICYRIHAQNQHETVTGLPYHPRPHVGTRILVLVPHPDDETIACGGLLHEAAMAGSTIRVVFVTNGDGFRIAVRRAYPRVTTTPSDYVRFGLKRQHEAITALARLGVPASDAIFLSYPDRGIARLWLTNWATNHPYTSPYTGAAFSPYLTAYHPGARYCGASLLADLEEIIRTFRPTEVYFPHPNDDHPDHWATSCFARAAMEHLGIADYTPAYTYLVHRGDWPVPQGLHPADALAPPAALAHLDTLWSASPLPQETQEAKAAALAAHRSQTVLMGRFLNSFVRRTELFGTLPRTYVPLAPPGVVCLDGNSADWASVPPAAVEPTGDTLPVRVEGSADLAALRACQDSQYLYLLLTSRRDLSSLLRYTVSLRTLDGSGRAVVVSFSPPALPSEPDVHVAIDGRNAEIAVPLARLGGARTLSVGASARGKRFTIDSTGWRVLRLNPQPQPSGPLAHRAPGAVSPRS